MGSDDNTVNIKIAAKARPSYHHGDLRSQLIETGMRLLEESHSDAPSLREVAREVGVSPTSVYRHFADKGALLRAIAARGFEMMGEMQVEAAGRASGRAAFAASGAAYVHFALAHPAVFRLMFASAPPRDLFGPKASELSLPLRLLREQVAQLTPAGGSEAVRKIVSIRAWALVHGLALLALDGMVQVDVREIEAIIGEGKEAVLF